MGNNVVEFVQALGKAGVAARADLKSFMRADEIMDSDLTALVNTGDTFTAQVVGTDVWVVRFELVLDDGAREADRLNVYCTCPVPEAWCKHAVAVARRMMKDPEWALSAPTGDVVVDDVDPVRRYGDIEVSTKDVVTSTLGIMNKQDLVRVVNELREKQPLIEPQVSKLVLPFSSQPFPGLEQVQYEIENTRIMFEIAHTDSLVEDAAEQLLYTGNLIRSNAGGQFNMQLLVALEKLMFDACRWAQAIALPVGPIVHALEQLHQHHVVMAHWEQPSALHTIDWLLDTYFAPGGYLPVRIKEYADLLDDDALELLIKRAHERRPLHPEVVLPLEIDVALIRNDMHELERLCDARGLHDGLLMFYVHNGMDLGAEKLVTAALDANDPVTVSSEMLYLAANQYFGDDGPRMYHRYWFQKDPSLANYLDFIRVPAVDFAEAVFVLQSVESVASDPDYMLLAAKEFERFDIGFDVINTGSPSARMAADFASSVGMAYDPVWAMGVVFVRIRKQLSQTVTIQSAAARKAELARVMEEIVVLRKEAEEAAGSTSIRTDWKTEVSALKQEFAGHPAVKEAFTDWEL
ncbi:hypothetical protein [Corynebacterium urinipleomorphum]|uniref:hypothetical protein n=1 Tax=Corynebacterium urinipleomorphum TaxID=1852380 RepID=UPI000B34D90F|nr:hypothetical protein [Corynebacterium urinipleomorphum]